jgi:hypothetical protein
MVVSTSMETGYLRATARGDFVLSIANQAFFHMLDIAARANAERVLVDARAMFGAPRALERYLYGTFIAQAVERLSLRGKEPPKFAYLLTPPMLHYGRLGEATARKRGMSVRAFETMNDAMTWLFSKER